MDILNLFESAFWKFYYTIIPPEKTEIHNSMRNVVIIISCLIVFLTSIFVLCECFSARKNPKQFVYDRTQCTARKMSEDRLMFSVLSKLRKPAFIQQALIRTSKKILEDTNEYPVVGIDCQWTQSWDEKRSKIGLLQIASHKGRVALIRLSDDEKVPKELLKILSSWHIIKCGIETIKDAQYLLEDYSIKVEGTYDLRYLAEANECTPDSLAKLSKQFLDVDLGKDFNLIASNWDGELSYEQVIYAQEAAKASVDIFKALISNVLWLPSKNQILDYCKEKLDKKYIYYSEKWTRPQIGHLMHKW